MRMCQINILNNICCRFFANAVRLYYVAAALDTTSSIKPEFFEKVYHNATKLDIIDSVFKYYQDHFTRRHERVIDVILTGKLAVRS